MANKWWYKSGANAAWATVTGNWWDDAAHTQQSAAVPATNDYVYLLGATSPSTGPAAITFTGFDSSGLTAGALAQAVTLNITIAAAGTLVMGLLGNNAASAQNHTWSGMATAAGISATFNASSYADGSYATQLGANVVFNDNSYCYSNMGNNCTFNNRFGGGGAFTCGTGCVFNHHAQLAGTCGANSIFNHGSHARKSATIGAGTVFYDFATNYSTGGTNTLASWPAVGNVRKDTTFQQNQTLASGTMSPVIIDD